MICRRGVEHCKYKLDHQYTRTLIVFFGFYNASTDTIIPFSVPENSLLLQKKRPDGGRIETEISGGTQMTHKTWTVDHGNTIFPDFFFYFFEKYFAYLSLITDPNEMMKESEYQLVAKDLHNLVPIDYSITSKRTTVDERRSFRGVKRSSRVSPHSSKI